MKEEILQLLEKWRESSTLLEKRIKKLEETQNYPFVTLIDRKLVLDSCIKDLEDICVCDAI